MAGRTRKASVAVLQENRQRSVAALFWEGGVSLIKMKKKKCIPAPMYCGWVDGNSFVWCFWYCYVTDECRLVFLIIFNPLFTERHISLYSWCSLPVWQNSVTGRWCNKIFHLWIAVTLMVCPIRPSLRRFYREN